MPAIPGGVAILSFVVAFVALRVILRRFARHALDHPNERSLHERPVPRTGGIAVILGTAVAAAFGAAQLWLPLLLALLLAVVSFLDDVRGISTLARLAVHLAASGIFVWYVLSPMNAVEMAVLVLALAWITNLYNFMDGSDGLAGGMAVIGFATYGFAAQTAQPSLAMLSFAIAAAAGAFLVHNVHPARIFLGDVGSIPLGFLAGALGVQGWRDDVWPLWFPLLVFAPFIGDATLTLLKRLLKARKVWQAHRDHYYQRMVRMGLGHRATAVIGYVLMGICATLALLGRGKAPPVQAACFGAGVAVLIGCAIWVDLRWKQSADAGRSA
jgi:UDP-N-acetylmuramyl pentapeptide phosphotransferase/UDP-N-acetylglucosamine-1-phosphate transferase